MVGRRREGRTPETVHCHCTHCTTQRWWGVVANNIGQSAAPTYTDTQIFRYPIYNREIRVFHSNLILFLCHCDGLMGIHSFC